MKNIHRTYGNNIIIGVKEGQTEYYNWKQDKMVNSKDEAIGYHSKKAANSVIEQLTRQFPDHTFITVLDKG